MDCRTGEEKRVTETPREIPRIAALCSPLVRTDKFSKSISLRKPANERYVQRTPEQTHDSTRSGQQLGPPRHVIRTLIVHSTQKTFLDIRQSILSAAGSARSSRRAVKENIIQRGSVHNFVLEHVAHTVAGKGLKAERT